jgi:hypothetical protein
MTVINKLVPFLHLPVAQQMTSTRTASAANMFVVSDPTGRSPVVMYVTSATVCWLYRPDGWGAITSPALATFGAGACGAFHPWSNTYTANGGTTTTATVAAGTHNITGVVVGETIEFVSSGTNNGLRRVITGIINNAGTGTITIQWSGAVATAVLNTHTFRITTGRFFIYGGGVTAAGSFKSFDIATRSWSGNLVVTGVPTFTNDGKMAIAYQLPVVQTSGQITAITNTTNAVITDSTKSWAIDQYKGCWVRIFAGTRAPNGSTGAVEAIMQITSNTATTVTLSGVFSTTPDTTSFYSIEDCLAGGIATSGSTTTLVNSGKAWTTNQWTNFRVRITGGTGLGQTALITSNTGTTLTFAAVGVAIAAGSVYEIEGDENSIYLAGNGAVAMYKHNISATTWATLAPTVARSVAPGASPSLNWVTSTLDANWTNESAIFNGRYLLSARGGGSGVIDQFDIAGGTAGAGAWAAVNIVNAETFTTGASYTVYNGYLIIEKEAASAARLIFVIDITSNVMRPLFSFLFPGGAAVTGNKLWIKGFNQSLPYDQSGGSQPYAYANNAVFLYSLASTSSAVHRVPLLLN